MQHEPEGSFQLLHVQLNLRQCGVRFSIPAQPPQRHALRPTRACRSNMEQTHCFRQSSRSVSQVTSVSRATLSCSYRVWFRVFAVSRCLRTSWRSANIASCSINHTPTAAPWQWSHKQAGVYIARLLQLAHPSVSFVVAESSMATQQCHQAREVFACTPPAQR